jgi:thioredoxin reductase (NADPH)
MTDRSKRFAYEDLDGLTITPPPVLKRLFAKYSPDQPRAPEGVPEGGQFVDDNTTSAKELEKYRALKARWAKVNNDLLKYVNNPADPEAQKLMDELKVISKEMYGLDVDPGGYAGVGLPGGVRDVVIVGAGPGGLAAGIMAGTDGLDAVVIEANTTVGGQAKYSSRIENFPGFPIGVTGEQLATTMLAQAERVGAEVQLGTKVVSISVEPETGYKLLTLDNGDTITTRSVILAGGVEFRHLDFQGSDGSNVIYGNGKALAELAAGDSAVVIGGSNGAAQAALGVAQLAEHVYVLARSPIAGSMSDYQVSALTNHPKITVIQGDQIESLQRDGAGNPIYVQTKLGQRLPAKAVGIFVGSAPSTRWLPTNIIGPSGKIKVNANLETDIPGVFAVGDVREGSIGRIGAAVGEGQIASKGIWDYFATTKKRQRP